MPPLKSANRNGNMWDAHTLCSYQLTYSHNLLYFCFADFLSTQAELLPRLPLAIQLLFSFLSSLSCSFQFKKKYIYIFSLPLLFFFFNSSLHTFLFLGFCYFLHVFPFIFVLLGFSLQIPSFLLLPAFSPTSRCLSSPLSFSPWGIIVFVDWNLQGLKPDT